MTHKHNLSLVFRSQRAAKSSQCFLLLVFICMGLGWLPLPVMAAINMLKLTPSVEFQTFLHFVVQVETNLQHLPNGLEECAAFFELVCLD